MATAAAFPTNDSSALFKFDPEFWARHDSVQLNTVAAFATTAFNEIEALRTDPEAIVSPRTRTFLANFGTTTAQRLAKLDMMTSVLGDFRRLFTQMALTTGVAFDVDMPTANTVNIMKTLVASDRSRMVLQYFCRTVYEAVEFLSAHSIHAASLVAVPALTTKTLTATPKDFTPGIGLAMASSQLVGQHRTDFDPLGQIDNGCADISPLVITGTMAEPNTVVTVALCINHPSLAGNALQTRSLEVFRLQFASAVAVALTNYIGEPGLCGALSTMLINNAIADPQDPAKDSAPTHVIEASFVAYVKQHEPTIAKAKAPKPPRVPKLNKKGLPRRSFVGIKKPRNLEVTLSQVRKVVDQAERFQKQFLIVGNKIQQRRFAHAKEKGAHGGARKGNRQASEVQVRGFEAELKMAESLGISKDAFLQGLREQNQAEWIPEAYGGAAPEGPEDEEGPEAEEAPQDEAEEAPEAPQGPVFDQAELGF